MGTDAPTVELPSIGPRRVAGMGRRLLARLLDGLVVGVPAGLVGALVIAGLSAGELPHIEAQQAAGVPNPQPSTGYVISVMAVLAVLAIGAVLYEIAMIAGLGATLGKQWAGVAVVSADSGSAPGWGRSAGRWAIPAVFGVVGGAWLVLAPGPVALAGLLLGWLCWLSPLFDSRRRGWHDKASNTVVVATK
jgi:uncharacterized RDD family membrane protein YckC